MTSLMLRVGRELRTARLLVDNDLAITLERSHSLGRLTGSLPLAPILSLNRAMSPPCT